MAPIHTDTSRVSGSANLEIVKQINNIVADFEHTKTIEKSTHHGASHNLPLIPTILQSTTVNARDLIPTNATNSTTINTKQPLPADFTFPRAIAAILAMFTLLSLFLFLSMLFCCGGYKFFVREAEFWCFKRKRAQFEAKVAAEELQEVLRRQKEDEEVLLNLGRLGYLGEEYLKMRDKEDMKGSGGMVQKPKLVINTGPRVDQRSLA